MNLQTNGGRELSNSKKALLMTSVASMIDQFNMQNVEVLLDMGVEPHIAANFVDGNTCTELELTALKQRLNELSVPYHQIDFDRNAFNLLSDIKAYKQIKKLCEEYNYSFIHCQSPIGGVVGRIAGKKAGIKTIYTAHGFHFFKGAGLKNWLFFYPVEKELSRFTDVLIVMNREDREAVKKHHFKAKRTVMFEPVGIDLKLYGGVDHARKKELKLKYEFNEDDFVLIFSGEFNDRKNQEFLIRAVPKLQQKIPNVKLVLSGKGPRMEAAQKLAEKLGVADSVVFKGFCPFDELVEHYQLSDLFVSASKQEGLPKNLKEGMACGLPAVVTRIRGNIDLIKEREGGLLCAIDDMDAFTKHVWKLYKLPETRDRMGKFNLKRVEKYSTDIAKRKIGKLYEEMLV